MKLPPIQDIYERSAQMDFLIRWLIEWKIESQMDGAEIEEIKEDSASPDHPVVMNRYDDVPIVPGNIRLLAPHCLAVTSRPLYVAVITHWSENRWLIAPYSAYSVPAASGELLTGRTDCALRVLCLWNARDVSSKVLGASWCVSEMTPRERDDAQAVLRYVAIGNDLPDHLLDRIGPHILQASDPRREYQRAEAVLLNALVEEDFSHQDVDSPIAERDWSLGALRLLDFDNILIKKPPSRSIIQASPLKMAARIRPASSSTVDTIPALFVPFSLLRAGEPISCTQMKQAGRLAQCRPVKTQTAGKENRISIAVKEWLLSGTLAEMVKVGARAVLFDTGSRKIVARGTVSLDGKHVQMDPVETESSPIDRQINPFDSMMIIECPDP